MMPCQNCGRQTSHIRGQRGACRRCYKPRVYLPKVQAVTMHDRTDAFVLWVRRDRVWWLVGWGSLQNAVAVAVDRYEGCEWEVTQGITGKAVAK
jgi:hypothetical protein